jgi:molecular chaperone GrpE
MNKEKDNAKRALKKSAEEHHVEDIISESDDTAEQLNQCKATLAEWQEKYARLTADLENYKKRTMKERSAWGESAQVVLLSELLSIVDNFDRAIEHQTEVPQELQAWADGIAMIHTAFKEFLKNAGVKEVPYNYFNPEYHEALMQVDSDAQEVGEIVDIMEKGYMLNDRVLRPAKVSVAK